MSLLLPPPAHPYASCAKDLAGRTLIVPTPKCQSNLAGRASPGLIEGNRIGPIQRG